MLCIAPKPQQNHNEVILLFISFLGASLSSEGSRLAPSHSQSRLAPDVCSFLSLCTRSGMPLASTTSTRDQTGTTTSESSTVMSYLDLNAPSPRCPHPSQTPSTMAMTLPASCTMPRARLQNLALKLSGPHNLAFILGRQKN